MYVVIALVAWVVFGLLVALIMIRRGHSTPIWLSLSFLGPLTVFLVLSAVDDEGVHPARVVPGQPGSGSVDVLVGLDGSPASDAALQAVPELFGDRLGRVTLGSVLDFDVDQLPGNPAPRLEADKRLAAAAAEFEATTGILPDQAVLTGKPAEALDAHARDLAVATLVIGTRGDGAHVALGSTAKSLATHGTVPVLLVPGSA